MPLLAFTQEVIERRTGKPKGAAGLDADALQSTTKSAADAVLVGGQGQMELMARVFCEGTLKPVFEGIGRLVAKKQPRKRMVRLRGNWVEVDPRAWTQPMDVICNVALGTTATEKKIEALTMVAGEQKEIASQLGPNNPLVGLGRIRATRAKILNLLGIKDVDTHYAPLPLDYQLPQPPQPPDPEQGWQQVEMQMNHVKTMKELAIKQDELNLERDKAQWDHDFKIRELAVETATKKYIADATNAQSTTEAQLAANIDMQAKETEYALQGQDQLHAQALDRAAHAHQTALAEDQQAHDQQMAERAADTADTAAQQPEGE